MTVAPGSVPGKKVSPNYPGNSNKQKVAPEGTDVQKEPRAEKIITGEVKQRKKPLGRKIAETFTGDDMHSVGTYVLFDVILPAAKSMIADAGREGLERLLFGDSRRSSSSSGGRSSYTSYNRMHNSAQDRPSGLSASRPLSNKSRSTHNFDEIVLQSRGEAEQVLEGLLTVLDQYDVATVSDLYDLLGISGSFADDKWGWTDLRGSSVSRVRDGYLLNLPRTTPID